MPLCRLADRPAGQSDVAFRPTIVGPERYDSAVEDIVVTELEGRWVVTREGIIVARGSTVRAALKVALQSAVETARSGAQVRVLMDDGGAPRRVVWDSRPTGAAAGRARATPDTL
jgi:hypothetical protein